MPINSKQKGAIGEREWAKFLTAHGFPAERGQQFKGGEDSPDVICRSLPIHWEVKRVQKLNLYAAMQQAIRDSGEKTKPAVAHRRNREEWLITMRAEDVLELIKKGVK